MQRQRNTRWTRASTVRSTEVRNQGKRGSSDSSKCQGLGLERTAFWPSSHPIGGSPEHMFDAASTSRGSCSNKAAGCATATLIRCCSQ